MFDLRDRGYNSPFEQLVGSLISARTRDETTVKVCLRLFEAARTPRQMLDLGEGELTRRLAIAAAKFHADDEERHGVDVSDCRTGNQRVIPPPSAARPHSNQTCTSRPACARISVLAGEGVK